jgi:hypothetical protein
MSISKRPLTKRPVTERPGLQEHKWQEKPEFQVGRTYSILSFQGKNSQNWHSLDFK